MRYVITERRNAAAPANDDVKSNACIMRHSGVYDLRDSHNANVIVATAGRAYAARKALRGMQARFNTQHFMKQWAFA